MNGRGLAAKLAGKDASSMSKGAPATPPHDKTDADNSAAEGEPDEEMDENLSGILDDLMEAHDKKDPKALHAAMKAHHHYMAANEDKDSQDGQPRKFGVVPPGDANRDG